MKLLQLTTTASVFSLLFFNIFTSSAEAQTQDSYSKTIRLNASFARPVNIRTSVRGRVVAQSDGCNKPGSYKTSPPGKVEVACGQAEAKASSSVKYRLTGRRLTGTLRVSGQVRLPSTGYVYATSSAKVVATAKVASRSVQTVNMSFDPFQLSQMTGENRLTSYFSAIDDKTGEILTQGTLFDIQSDYEGTIGWKNGAIDLSGFKSGIFSIDLGNEFSNLEGNLLIEYKDGVMTRSEDTGLFAGLLSPTPGPSGLRLGNSLVGGGREIDFSFTLPSFAKAVSLPHTIQWTGGPIRIKRKADVPEPITIVGTLSGFGIMMGWRRRSLKLSQKK
jgi:hypothetical protein